MFEDFENLDGELICFCSQCWNIYVRYFELWQGHIQDYDPYHISTCELCKDSAPLHWSMKKYENDYISDEEVELKVKKKLNPTAE